MIVFKSLLEGKAAESFDARNETHGEFVSYEEAKAWLMVHYTEADPVNPDGDAFFCLSIWCFKKVNLT
jgi:hypothetical protein